MTDQTRGMIDAKALAKTKPGVRIVNCARGGLVDEEDLKAAIESGHVAGAALDVFAVEPAKANPLFGLDQVVATPHLGASTGEAQEKVALQVAEQMADFLLPARSPTPQHALGHRRGGQAPEALHELAEQLGSFAGQLTETGLSAGDHRVRGPGGAAQHPAADPGRALPAC
jgi:D-3-phosphoglycerate dehydrogenase / 2-oxoglutarate reductase